MANRSENTVTINHPAQKVHEAYTNADYWAYIAENLSPEPGELNDFSNNSATLFEVLPLDVLPEAVRAMVSQALKLKRVVTVGELNGESADLSYTGDVKGTPVDMKGDIKLTGDGDVTTLAYDNEVTVDIPFMGPAIEPKVGEALAEIFTNEGKLTETWISENL
ncbi:DUF2505 domain-containing protein [Corynebacterium cystitidis]|uniref:DUF2505 domain-containing protein n=1 Tax=Corynebacterium cystitidis DSM 20524 TaxID=1121357 RepID=A0A1H9VZD8_9CORY|nr:DUF2505 domain-containing protein [Corynebacterium cystitidis]WJY81342.1 hypothetical protein CCYS_01845 [Corynebacterium cystitidis DSM 20524]SES27110.1 Protein of unknown function [Corynebacterium cystitidis DSM 20524]SNV88252.1 Protein of uncharacterised function (DUF2505) [Corynebacterium cystitidis]